MISRASFNRLFCLLMAIYVINFSVDPPDGHITISKHGVVKEDLRVNEMESLAEWFLERFLGIHNAIPEHDDSSDERSKVAKSIHFWIAPDAPLLFLLPSTDRILNRVTYVFCPSGFTPYYSEIHSPPPQRS